MPFYRGTYQCLGITQIIYDKFGPITLTDGINRRLLLWFSIIERGINFT
jgi:hypothetical protein